jgi:hypothetical protein
MPRPKDFEELRRYLEERGDEDLADAILPLEELAPPELIERYPVLKNLALVALSELTDEEVEDILAEMDEDEEPRRNPQNHRTAQLDRESVHVRPDNF